MLAFSSPLQQTFFPMPFGPPLIHGGIGNPACAPSLHLTLDFLSAASAARRTHRKHSFNRRAGQIGSRFFLRGNACPGTLGRPPYRWYSGEAERTLRRY